MNDKLRGTLCNMHKPHRRRNQITAQQCSKSCAAQSQQAKVKLQTLKNHSKQAWVGQRVKNEGIKRRAISSRKNRGQSGTQVMHHTQPPPYVLCVSTWTHTSSGSHASPTNRRQTDIKSASRQTGASTRHPKHMGMSIRHRACTQTSMHKHTGHTQPSKSQHDCTQTSTKRGIKATD